MDKLRIDEYLVAEGHAANKKQAHALVLAGLVYVGEQRAYSAAQTVLRTAPVTVRGKKNAFVSRGGDKLLGAITRFDLSLNGKIAMDVGASTGGFTDCMLQHGAKRVYSVDVGYGQLAWSLRCDSRVVNLERTNIRLLDPGSIEPLGFVSIDVSFISLKLVLPVVKLLLQPDGEAVALVKPQFEAARGQVPKGGVVRDIQVHQRVLEEVWLAAQQTGFAVAGLWYSPIRGPEGNIEYLLWLKHNPQTESLDNTTQIQEITTLAHQTL